MDLVDILFGISRASIGFRVLLNPIFKPIPSVANDLLQGLRNQIEESYLLAFDEHVSKINYTQLQSANRLFVLFQWKFPGRYNWNRENYFDPIEGTKKLLNFKIIFDNGSELHGNLVSIDGVLCNITFGENLSFYRKFKISKVIAKSGTIKKREKAQA